MRTSLPPPRRRPAPLLALAALAAAVPLLAQTGDTALPAPGFPTPVWLALIVAGVCGAVGAFAADLVTDGGRIEQWRRDEAGWSLGFFAKMLIGLVAAVVFLTLNPPGNSWPTMVGSALVAGLGGEAILLAIIASRRAQKAQMEAAHAEAEVRETLDAWAENLRTFESVALAAVRTVPAATASADAMPSHEAWSDAEPAPSSPLAVVTAYADHAVAEVRRRGGRSDSE